MNREYHQWHSPRLGRGMELLVFGHAGAKVLVFPTRCARFHEYEDMGLVEALRDKIDQGVLQLYCVDSIDAESLYAQWKRPADRLPRHLQYEDYLLHEVLPFMHHRNPHPCVIAHGCSFGAFHALNLTLRHPSAFRKVVALSGRYDLTLAVDGFRNLLDGHYDDTVYFNNPSHYVPNLADQALIGAWRGLDIALVVGDEDPFLDNNRQLSGSLSRLGVRHALHTWPGRAHGPRCWRGMVAMAV